MSIRELFERFTELRLIHAKPHTKRKYGYAITRLDRHLGRSSGLADFNDATLIRFRAALLEEGLTRATANSYVAHLVSLWNFAFRQGLTRTAPAIRELPEVKREPVALSVDQVAAVLEATNGLGYSIAGIPAAKWWRALFLTLYDTGLRVSAARAMLWGDLREADRSVMVRGEYQKTFKDARKRVADDTWAAILSIRHPVRRLVFPWDRCPTHFWALARDVFTRAGLPDDRRFRCHAFRRTHGTLVAATLGDFVAAESLQHANVRTFQEHYRDGSMMPAENVLAALPRP